MEKYPQRVSTKCIHSGIHTVFETTFRLSRSIHKSIHTGIHKMYALKYPCIFGTTFRLSVSGSIHKSITLASTKVSTEVSTSSPPLFSPTAALSTSAGCRAVLTPGCLCHPRGPQHKCQLSWVVFYCPASILTRAVLSTSAGCRGVVFLLPGLYSHLSPLSHRPSSCGCRLPVVPPSESPDRKTQCCRCLPIFRRAALEGLKYTPRAYFESTSSLEDLLTLAKTKEQVK